MLSHLPPASLAETALVSHHFHRIVTTPHPWRIAFSRYFPGSDSVRDIEAFQAVYVDGDTGASEPRAFTRLTALASWRSEYIVRTRLLRAIGRGKPAELTHSSQRGSRAGQSKVTAQITYNTNLITPITHVHASFGNGLNKKSLLFIHGTDETGLACLSDPRTCKVEQWGFTDPASFAQFIDRNPGFIEYGLDPSDLVGMPNCMDVSQPCGMVYGEGWPGGSAYYRATEEKRGRPLKTFSQLAVPEEGIPLMPTSDTICSVWIAKTSNIPDITSGCAGILIGTASGTLSAYSLGVNNLRDRRLERGELTTRWVVSPGVPIVAIRVDDQYTPRRFSSGRAWAAVLNALGEVYYLFDLPKRPVLSNSARMDQTDIDALAWQTGKTARWSMVGPTRRCIKPDSFGQSEIDRAYTPQLSSSEEKKTQTELTKETVEVEAFMQQKPSYFRSICEGWDMQRKLEVDFAAGNDTQTGETFIVINCGILEESTPYIKMYTRLKSISSDTQGMPLGKIEDTRNWRACDVVLRGARSFSITVAALDMSSFAVLTCSEDPLLGLSGSSTASSPLSSPLGQMPLPGSPADIPGQRARLLAVGTSIGSIHLWNVRGGTSTKTTMTMQPVRVICTDSPQISSLALNSAYLVHGGNDGLVQAWDILASTLEPVRTLNSRFSSRARRRLVQAEASAQGIGLNLFAAGAICLDSDPTSLRGMVSIGTHLRYWSYSSASADSYKRGKRRMRRSERGSNDNGERFSGTGRGAISEYILNEKLELEREERTKRKAEKRLASRFGTALLGSDASEEEMLAYATMLSEESAASDEAKRQSSSPTISTGSEETIVEAANELSVAESEEDLDADVLEAIRRSLGDQSGGQASVSDSGFRIKQAKSRRSRSASPKDFSSESEIAAEVDDLEFALRLSAVEEHSRRGTATAGAPGGKGKGRAV